MPKQFCVYILASKRHGTLYIGMTSSLSKRINEHKQHMIKGFTDKYNITKLVYAETHATYYSAKVREKQLKEWHRQWKIRLIEELNPGWDDLTERTDFALG